MYQNISQKFDSFFRSIPQFNRNYTREKKNKPYFYLEIIITATKVKHTNDVIRNWRTTRSCFLFFFLLPPVISKKQWTVNYRLRWKLLTYNSIDAYPSPRQGGDSKLD